ncbi:MAG: glycogen/starch synthase [Patescibacteria group bacterium]
MATNQIIKVLENLITDVPENRGVAPMKILMVGAEVYPYASVGGYAMVLNYLSRALAAKGHDVRVFMPKFGFIDKGTQFDLETVIEGLRVPTDDPSEPYLICNVKVHRTSAGVMTYFLENMEYYEKRANVYGYVDDAVRWALLSRGALEFIRTGMFIPDIIHTHDWHTSVLCDYVNRNYRDDDILNDISTVLTIHSMGHQGMFNHRHVSELDYDDGRSSVAALLSDRINKQNFLRRGILYADMLTTVSKTYAKEILTPEYGECLDKLLLEVRSKLVGIVNGLNNVDFNPSTDPLLAKNFDIHTLPNRVENKYALQDALGLPIKQDALVVGMLGRLDGQKGTDLAIKTMRHVLKDFNVQFVQVGGGDGGLAEQLRGLHAEFPTKVGIHPYPNFSNLPRLMFGGSDVMLFPSRFEPCGIVQMEAMRYGSIPIVRDIGGLADTVTAFNSVTQEGTGLKFNDFNEFALFGQIVRAIELFQHKKLWNTLQKNAMSTDFSWSVRAQDYEKVYKAAQALHRKAFTRGVLDLD